MDQNTHPAIDENQVWADFNAKWTPICSAWKAAKLCRDLATALPDALHNAASQEAYLPGLSTDPTIVAGLVSMLNNKAMLLEAANPLPMVPTDDDRQAFHEEIAECYDDRDTLTDLSVELHTDADIASWAAEAALYETIG